MTITAISSNTSSRLSLIEASEDVPKCVRPFNQHSAIHHVGLGPLIGVSIIARLAGQFEKKRVNDYIKIALKIYACILTWYEFNREVRVGVNHG
jgi:hypothetical protein